MTQDSAPVEFEGRLQEGKDWREIVAWVGDLPPMPNVAARAISMVEDPDTTANDLTKLLSNDTALAARVLKIANSAMFSRQREITTLNQAIMTIGFKALKGVIVAATLRQINKRFGKIEKLIWENSMCTALAATHISRRLRKRYTEEIFLLGLLHSLGQIVILAQNETAAQYKDVLNLIKENSFDYALAEQEVYGFAHPLIGALVAKKWNFSAETCQVILHYRDPLDDSNLEGELDEKTLLVRVADLISHRIEVGSPAGYPDGIDELKAGLTKLGIAADEQESFLEEIEMQTKEQFEREQSLYG